MKGKVCRKRADSISPIQHSFTEFATSRITTQIDAAVTGQWKAFLEKVYSMTLKLKLPNFPRYCEDEDIAESIENCKQTINILKFEHNFSYLVQKCM